MRHNLDCTRDTDQQYNIANSMSRNRWAQLLNQIKRAYQEECNGEEGEYNEFKEAVDSMVNHLNPNHAAQLLDGLSKREISQIEESPVLPSKEQGPSSQESIKRLDRMLQHMNRRNLRKNPLIRKNPFEKRQLSKEVKMKEKLKNEVEQDRREVSQGKNIRPKQIDHKPKSVKVIDSSPQRLRTESIQKRVWRPLEKKDSKARMNVHIGKNLKAELKPRAEQPNSFFNRNLRNISKADESSVSKQQQQTSQNVLNSRRDLMAEIIKNRKNY